MHLHERIVMGKKIGFIGAGNMAEAMIAGILKKGIIPATDIIASRRNKAALDVLKDKYGVEITTDNKEVAKAEIVVLAVKPQFMKDAIQEIKDVVTEEQIILSIAAGKTIAFMENEFGGTRKIVRCMPNTPALVLEGSTGVSHNKNVSDIELNRVLDILKSCGFAAVVDEKLMDAVVGISGSAPAYVFMFIEALADAGVAAGMPRKLAYEFAAQLVKGSATLMQETGKHPAELKDMVCSPGGTTIEAVKVLEDCGFRSAIMNAVDACVEKSKIL